MQSGIKPSPLGIALVIGLFVLSGVYFMTSNNDPDIVSLRSLLIASIDVAEKGGDQVRAIRLRNDQLDAESKGDTKEGAKMLVTDGDFASNRAMKYPLKKAFPNVFIVSEEKDEDVEDVVPVKTTNAEVDLLAIGDQLVHADDVTVWIDPLDATQEYSENLREYVTTMVCIAVEGKPIIGVIHKPFTGETAWAWVGHGTNVEYQTPPSGEQVIVSRSHAGSVEKVVKDAFGEQAQVTPAGGAGYKTLALYDGSATVYVHTTLIKKWDICSGNAILDATGGSMTTLDGQTIDYSPGDVRNEGGLLAAKVNHGRYLEKMGIALKGAK